MLTMHKQHQPQRKRAGFGRSRISFAGRVVSLCLVGLMVLQLPGTAIYPIFAPLLHASPLHDVPQHDMPLGDVPLVDVPQHDVPASPVPGLETPLLEAPAHEASAHDAPPQNRSSANIVADMKDNEPDCHATDTDEGQMHEGQMHEVQMHEGQMHEGKIQKHRTQANANRSNRSAHDCCNLQPEPSGLSALGTNEGSSPLMSCAHSSSANSCASDSSGTHGDSCGSSGTHCDSAEVCGCSVDQTSTRQAFTLPPVLSSCTTVRVAISPVPFFDTGLTADSNDRNPGTLDSPPLYLLYDTWLI